jgi:YHS domain-containing protein
MRRIRIVQALGCCLALVVSTARIAGAQENGGVVGTPSIQWLTSDQEAADKSTREGKPVLIRITATWCRPCQQMKQLTFTDSRVVKLVEANFIPLLIDADAHPDLVSLYKVEAYPTTLVMGADKSVLKKLTGFQSGDSLVTALLPLAKTVPKGDGANSSGDLISALEPENGLKMAFDGYCLVSLLEETKVLKGSAEFAAEYRGQTVCFTSAEQRQKFLDAPDKYWPVANGKCLVSSRDGLLAGVGDPRMAVTWRGRIWLFSDRARQRRFIQSPKYYAGEM